MTMIKMDLYKILGLEKNASKDEIKKAYRLLSLKYHPDKNQTNDTTLMFQSINDSYSILYDDNKRRDYDHGEKGFYYDRYKDLHQDRHSSDRTTYPRMPFKDTMQMQGNIHILNSPEYNSNFMNSSESNGRYYGEQYYSHYHPNQMQKDGSHLPMNIIKELEITLEQSYNGCDVPIEIVRFVYDGNIKKKE